MATDIVSLIRTEVAYLDIGTGNPPLFDYGPDTQQNKIADRMNAENAIVFLHFPIISKDDPKTSGAYGETYEIVLFFGMKILSKEWYDYNKQRETTLLMRALRLQLYNRLNALINTTVHSITDIRTIEVLNKYDKNLTGVTYDFNLTVIGGDSVCIVASDVVAGDVTFVISTAELIVTTYDIEFTHSGLISINRRSLIITPYDIEFSATGTINIDTASLIITPEDIALIPEDAGEPNYIDEIFTDYTVTRVTYTGSLLMDIYEPVDDPNTSARFVIICCAGESEFDAFQPEKLAKALVKRGYRVASIQYYESVGQLAGVRCFWRATRYLKAHAVAYGIDPNRGLGYGFSYGGFIAFQAGIAWDNSDAAYFDDPINSEDAGYSNRISGTASQSGAASSIYLNNYLEFYDVPHFSWHGDEDETVPYEWDEEAVIAMQELGIASTITPLPGGHGLDLDDIIPDLVLKFASVFNVTLDTVAVKPIETEIGLNVLQSDVPNLANWTPLTLALAPQFIYYTPTTPSISGSDQTAINNFLTAIGAGIAVYYPIQSDAVAAAFPAFLDEIVAALNPIMIQLDQESQEGAGIDNAVYISRAQAVIAHIPLIRTSWDTAPIWKTNPTGPSWLRNLALAPLTDTDEGKIYNHVSPDGVTFGADQLTNLSLLSYYIDILVEQYLDDYITRLPNITKQNSLQWDTEEAGGNFVRDKPLGNLAVGEVARFFLTNTEHFGSLIFMKLGNLIANDLTAKPEHVSIKRIVPAFKFAQTMPVTILYSGCKQQAFWNGVNSWAMLVNNRTPYDHIVRREDIVIPGKTVTGDLTCDSGTAASLDSALQNTIVIAPTATVGPYGVNMIYFNTVDE